jgi:uncharacterized protein
VKLTLRPHHILCRLGFVGYGYSPEFIEEMARTAKALGSGRVKRVVFKPGFDPICSACPHKLGECRPETIGHRGRAAAEFDLRALRTLKIKLGYAYTLPDIDLRIAELDEDAFSRICQGCEWQPLGACLKGYQTLKHKFFPQPS